MNFAKFSMILVVCLSLGGYSTALPALGSILDPVIEAAARGISITVADKTISVGTVDVPLELLCGDLNSELPEPCHICNVDCYTTHNATGGQCKLQPSGKSACICDYSANAVRPTCPSYTDNRAKSASLDDLVDSALAQVLRLRYKSVICGQYTNPTGTCNVECRDNHAANNGTCVGFNYQNPFANEGFCICNY